MLVKFFFSDFDLAGQIIAEGDLPFHDITVCCQSLSANHLCKLHKAACGRTMSEMHLKR
ncbi:MAG: hypothetical protein KBA18_06595 [Kiritimatiellae bacterium]|nr:hypothetical protein [Kiritimatiellia bacterium]NLG01936.1 hypothetical protein [Lentisphaerota bacterium]